MKEMLKLENEIMGIYINGEMEEFYKTEQRIERYDTKQENKKVRRDEDE